MDGTNLFVTSERKEAVFLGDRLLVMTPGPTRVTRVVDIDLPRPRTLGMLTSARFREIYEEALAALRAEGATALAPSH